MLAPIPTPVYRITHFENLHVILSREGLAAPNFTPEDGLVYRTCHNVEIQGKRQIKPIICGPRGVIHDYVPFYFGYLSPMMLQLKTGQVPGYQGGQEVLIYLVTDCQTISGNGLGYVFSDGHGVVAFTRWFDDLAHLGEIDWKVVAMRYWKDTNDDPDRKRRKQAEFLVHRFCNWSFIHEIGVIDSAMKAKVEDIISEYPPQLWRPVNVRRNWYY